MMKKLLALLSCVVLLLTFAACRKEEQPKNTDLNMEAVYSKLCKAAALPPMLDLDKDLMLDYCGIKADTVKQAMVLICEDSLRTDEIWLIEANDEDTAKQIKELADKRLKAKAAESETYSPQQYAVVQKAELIQTGSYVALFVSPDSAALAQAFRQEAGI